MSISFIDNERIVILCKTEELCEESIAKALEPFNTSTEGIARDDDLLL